MTVALSSEMIKPANAARGCRTMRLARLARHICRPVQRLHAITSIGCNPLIDHDLIGPDQAKDMPGPLIKQVEVEVIVGQSFRQVLQPVDARLKVCPLNLRGLDLVKNLDTDKNTVGPVDGGMRKVDRQARHDEDEEIGPKPISSSHFNTFYQNLRKSLMEKLFAKPFAPSTLRENRGAPAMRTIPIREVVA